VVRTSTALSAPGLRFLGAAGTVTGSRFLITAGPDRILIDCGLFQGLKELRLRNWEPPHIDPKSLNAVVLTHAHLDHSGYLPALCRDGFRREIFTTGGTHALCRVLLPDSGHLQEEEAEYANRKGYSRHTPARPLYTEDDARRVLEHFEERGLQSGFEVSPGVRVTFRPAGHILGASTVSVEIDSKQPRTLLFSGDLGRPSHPILKPPEAPVAADVIVVESTYGDRRHDDAASLKLFEEAIVRTAARRGTIVIPSFAVDRTEVILFHLRRLLGAGRIPEMPVYVDSPMALAALKLYRAEIARGNPEIRTEMVRKPQLLDLPQLYEARTVEESIAINSVPGPIVIISASGMATGGRVVHHLARCLPDANNTVILVGYQALGTRGRSLLDGAPMVKMLGRYVPVRAEIVDVPAFSVHADQAEIIGWLRTSPRAPDTCYIVHGDPSAAATLCHEIRTQLHWNAVVPRHLEQVRLD